MISVNYVNGSIMDISAYDPFNVFESELNDVLDSVHNAYTEYQEAMSEYNLSVEFFEASDDVKLEAAAEKKANFIDKLGAAIIEVGKKAVAFINNIISKIQESLFASKSDMQKVSALCKKNPDMADDINKAFKEGNLQVADLRSIKELEAAYDEIMKLAQRQDVDPNTLKGKWINAKKKFGNLNEADIVKGVTAAVGLGVTISKIPDIIDSFKNWRQNSSTKTEMAMLALEEQRNKTETSAIKLAEAKRQQSMGQKIDSARLQEQRNKAKNSADNELNVINKQKAKIDLDEAKRKQSMNQKIDSNRLSESIHKASKANSDAEKSKVDLARSLNKLRKESVEELTFDENGYITESASDAVLSVISSIHSDMMKVYTVLANFNYRNLSKAKAIIASAVKGYQKDPKTVDKNN